MSEQATPEEYVTITPGYFQPKKFLIDVAPTAGEDIADKTSDVVERTRPTLLEYLVIGVLFVLKPREAYDIYSSYSGNRKSRPIEFQTDSEANAITWKGLTIPDELRILRGYERPDYSDVGGGYPEFQDWVHRTLATEDERTIRDSITFLELKSAYYDWLHDVADDYLSKDGRIQSRLVKGLDKLRQGLEALAN